MSDGNTLRKEDILALPRPVQKYMEYTRVLGKGKVETANLKQVGYFKINGKWKKLKAKQYFDFGNKSFVWRARIGAMSVTDQYVNGKGLLKVKLFGLVPLLKATGEEVDQGEVLRLLSEMIWFPSSLLSDYIHWQHIDGNTAKATIAYGKKDASAIFHFQDNGKLVSIKAKRYREEKGSFTLEDWEVGNLIYKEFSGGYLPHKGEVAWKLKGKDEVYCKIEIEQIEINT